MMLSIVLASLAGSLGPAQGIPIPVRPRDPFVFRCVLDRRPRMVTIAASDDMWIAYDTTTCGMYRAWKGRVNFDGAVYTTVHGPQPTSVGEPYTVGPAGDVWGARIGEKEVPVRARWLGYQLHGGRAHLNYELFLEDGHRIRVQETPDYISTEAVLPPDIMEQFALVHGMPGLYRSFSVEAIPPDVTLYLKVYTDGVAAKFPYPPDVIGDEHDVDVIGPGDVTTRRMQSSLAFNHERLIANLVLFYEPLPDLPVEVQTPDAHEKK